MKKIIFLDVDGVLAGYSYLKKGKGFIDPDKVKLLNQLKGCEIVISSSWGNDADKPLKELGLKLPIIGHTNLRSLGCDWLCRGNEIEEWLLNTFGGMGSKYGKEYQDKNYKYVIFDDDTDMLLGQKDNFVKTNRETGITQRDINKAKKILNYEENITLA